MKLLKPYLIKAIRDWITDNNETTYIVVRTTHPYTIVPVDYSAHEKITLDISPNAISNLQWDDEKITFNAKFSGVDTYISIPFEAVLSIFSKECGNGMTFDLSKPPEPDPPKKDNPKPVLRIVK